jgi:hypothetical protein
MLAFVGREVGVSKPVVDCLNLFLFCVWECGYNQGVLDSGMIAFYKPNFNSVKSLQ